MKRYLFAVCSVGFVSILLLFFASKIAAQSPLIIGLSSNGRYLINPSTGKPVFIVGDSPQDMDEMLDSAQVTQYLTDRRSRGFNALWVIITDKFQTNPPYNFYGYKPFDGADFTNFDSHYFSFVDSVVTEAANDGMIVFLTPFFVGNSQYESGYEVSMDDSSNAVLQGYAGFLGNRYKGYSNIIWLLGGDAAPAHAGTYSKLDVFGAALAVADPNHLITLEACDGGCDFNNPYNSVSGFQAAGLAVPSWLKLNSAHPNYTGTVTASNNAYKQSPWVPPLCAENFYELEQNTTEPGLRFEMYTEVLAGCYLGRIAGNGAIWSFNSRNGSSCEGNSYTSCPAWTTQLGSPMYVAMEYQGKLFRSREHWLLVPDISHTVVTAGYGSGASVTTTARTSDGQTIISYIPNGKATTITVNVAKITSATSTIQGWWYNPRSGITSVNIGTFPNTGYKKFTPPDSNDWVLVLDDENAHLAAP